MRRRYLNIWMDYIDLRTVVYAIEQACSNKKQLAIVPVNVDVLVKAERDLNLKESIEAADYILADGQILLWIAKLFKMPFPEKVSGSDLVPRVCAMAASKKYSIFIMGGKEGVAEKAGENLKKSIPNIIIAGCYCPPFGFENDQKEIEKMNEAVNKARPDILLLCLGCPKQEKYLYEQQRKYCATVTICAGATVDFLAGTIRRAPRWMSQCGLEWFYRFLKEPRRLFKRYFIDDIRIIPMIWKYRKIL